MATAHQQKPSRSDEYVRPAAAAPSGTPRSPAQHGNDNVDPTTPDLVRVKEYTWHIFARALLLGGLGAGLCVAAVVLFIYS